MKTNHEKKVLSLSACRKLLPIISTGKYIFFLAALFFQQEDTMAIFVVCVSLTLMFIAADSFLKISAWKCPHCRKVLPHDFYSRKTMTDCPNCGAALDFSDKRVFVPEPPHPESPAGGAEAESAQGDGPAAP